MLQLPDGVDRYLQDIRKEPDILAVHQEAGHSVIFWTVFSKLRKTLCVEVQRCQMFHVYTKLTEDITLPLAEDHIHFVLI